MGEMSELKEDIQKRHIGAAYADTPDCQETGVQEPRNQGLQRSEAALQGGAGVRVRAACVLDRLSRKRGAEQGPPMPTRKPLEERSMVCMSVPMATLVAASSYSAASSGLP